MVRILLVLFFIFQAAPSFASGSLVMPDPPVLESSPKSKEIKKVTKILEDPIEREKLIKTLKVLAATQEAEEKKRGSSLVSYLTPLIQYGAERATAVFMNLKKVPDFFHRGIDYLKIDQNKEDFWTALKWFPLLFIIGALLEGGLTFFFQRRLLTRYQDLEEEMLEDKKKLYDYMTLFYPFLYSLLFLPFFVSSASVGNWIVGFWLALFAIRMFVHERRRSFQKAHEKSKSESLSKTGPFFYFLGAIGLWAITLIGLSYVFESKIYGEDLLLKVNLAMIFPVLVLYFREWKTEVMPRHLVDSKTLLTLPHKMAPLMNLLIHYIPWVLILISVPLCINKIFFEGDLWDIYAPDTIETFLILVLFIWGRRYIDALAQYKIPKVQSLKLQALTSYIDHLRSPLLRGVQWIWHIAFLGSLLAIWNHCFSSFFIDMFSHPISKTMLTLGLIWGILYLLWLGLDFFVYFHTKPQTIKGKRREPTIFAKTFGPMLHSIARWIMVLVGFFVTLESFGFDLKILVYVMSAFAFAISLGSQSLVKDIINGFFALVDGSFAVGEVVTVGTHTGTVESLSLRAITLRHRDGSLQTIPFSEVGNIINRSRDFTVVPIDVATSYKTKIGQVYEALSEAFNEMTKDPFFGKMILEPLTFSGIDRFAENAVHVSASIKITPDPNNKFAQEFNRRLKTHLDALNIAPPIAFQEEWSKSKK